MKYNTLAKYMANTPINMPLDQRDMDVMYNSIKREIEIHTWTNAPPSRMRKPMCLAYHEMYTAMLGELVAYAQSMNLVADGDPGQVRDLVHGPNGRAWWEKG